MHAVSSPNSSHSQRELILCNVWPRQLLYVYYLNILVIIRHYMYMYIAIFIGHYRICRSAASASVTYGCSRLYCISSAIARSARSVWHTGKVAEHLSDTLYKQLVCRHPDVNTRANYRRNRKPLIGDKWIWVLPSDESFQSLLSRDVTEDQCCMGWEGERIWNNRWMLAAHICFHCLTP